MLQYRIGGTGETGRVCLKAVGDSQLSDPPTLVEGTIPDWKRAAVLTQTREGFRYIEIEPGPVEGAVRVGELFVRGRFNVARRIGTSQEATHAWDQFLPE